MIEIKNVSYSYENAVTDGALKNVSLCIPQGQTVLLCGKSGSGKTTFGRLVNGLIPCYYEGKLTGSVISTSTQHLPSDHRETQPFAPVIQRSADAPSNSRETTLLLTLNRIHTPPLLPI